jgi:predicted N-acetyltransferase YhbS
MGKIFPLNQRPELFEPTLKLIEKSFHYSSKNSFQTDFAPLIDESNHHNCFIFVDEKENVLAHIGVKERKIVIRDKNFPIIMFGGIAVDEIRRGEGIFQKLFIDVLTEKKDGAALLLLWSDLSKLYNKFGFYLCGSQFETNSNRSETTFSPTKLHLLSSSEKNDLKSLFENSFSKIYLTLKRTDEDWNCLEKITSADLFIRKNEDQINEYYFMNKGEDLPEIIYEYGTMGKIEDLLKRICHFGKVWTGKEIVSANQTQYQFLMSPGEQSLFNEFIQSFTENRVSIRAINSIKQEVYFDFNNETLGLSIDEFLRGMFGPDGFEELPLPSLFISGLESI